MDIFKKKGTQIIPKASFKANIINYDGKLTFKEARTTSDGRNCVHYIQPTDEETEKLIAYLSKHKKKHELIKELKDRYSHKYPKWFRNCLAWVNNKVMVK